MIRSTLPHMQPSAGCMWGFSFYDAKPVTLLKSINGTGQMQNVKSLIAELEQTLSRIDDK